MLFSINAGFDFGNLKWSHLGIQFAHSLTTFKMRALAGEKYAQEDLGDLYERGGSGLEKNLIEAYNFFLIMLERTNGQISFTCRRLSA
jgi:TPR repeat protein